MIITNRFWIEFTLLITLTMTLIQLTHAAPPPYCSQQLNVSDCGGPPTGVFSYWKPGSRCELNFWRGCPTLNKFPNQFLCSHYCVGKLGSNSIERDADDNTLLQPSEDPCSGKINTGDCGRTEKVVYTYDERSRSCRKVMWKGCESDNMFSSKETCDEMCLKFDANSFTISKKIDQLDANQLEQLNSILDDFLGHGHGEATEGKVAVNVSYSQTCMKTAAF